ncbi:related to CCE1 Cruciform-cutting endonuclease, mitochondrial [Phialocephala subalpina]|uniref:Related to CCE1 Cruciform-cutting endonuclease, mitochondrial n=1 Tax=Phialocephala subalpina TaxID=576137 RepID=A0A1L7X3V3_9HELO|nr:related to CCE1 Cruciform-cutting endonuclease, mitochondrial [Phialocephala subalpina]
MALKIPTTLKLAQLKHIAFKCGISSSGTKPLLTQRLIHEINSVPRHASPRVRILSIDMGIRNLAYCVLNVPPEPKSESKKSGTALPSILAWHRLAVSSAPKQSGDIDTPPTKEAFDPATLSFAAYTLLRERMLVENPTHILIERQRFRSNGSRHILEWTVRVNMFESILYATLHTLKAEGLWKGEVRAIQPGKVGPFWVGDGKDDGEGKKRSSKIAKIQNKGAKIDLVRRWLLSGDVVALGSEGVENMANAYKEKWAKLPGAPKGKRQDAKSREEKMGKLDDLADWAKIDLVRRWLLSGDVVALGSEGVENMANAYKEKWAKLPGAPKGKRQDAKSREEKMGKLDDLADCLLQG